MGRTKNILAVVNNTIFNKGDAATVFKNLLYLQWGLQQ